MRMANKGFSLRRNKNSIPGKLLYRYPSLEGKIYFLFDEIQNVNSWEKCVNSYLVDFDSDIYITGSNAKLLSGELATHIAGRYVEIKIYPFSFKEVLKIKEKRNNLNLNPKDKKEELLLKLEEKETFEEYIEYGGMPAIFKIEDKEAKKEYSKVEEQYLKIYCFSGTYFYNVFSSSIMDDEILFPEESS